MAWGWMTTEPTKAVPRDRRGEKPKVRHIKPADLQAFFSAMATVVDDPKRPTPVPFLVPMMRLILGCGLRREEARMLCTTDLDWGTEVDVEKVVSADRAAESAGFTADHY
ncbi:MAG: hypothetical protein PF961_11390, partial [Planctomycetota bacterium]|nr:hypothetical protein [Planctomycetota bacterium]